MSTPTWFTDAIAEPFDTDEVDRGRRSHQLSGLGQAGSPRASSSSTAELPTPAGGTTSPRSSPPSTASSRSTCPGHGDSDRRADYSLATWADEVLAVAPRESVGRPVIAGHSMGGFVGLTAAKLHGESVRGVVAIDSPVREISPEAKTWLRSNPTMPNAEGASGPADRDRAVPDSA